MEEKYSEIAKLKTFIMHIIDLNDERGRHIEQLQSKNEQLQNELEEKIQIINDLNEKTETLRIAKSISLSDEDKTEVKNKINKIVREIDKSIGLLNE